LAFIFNTSQRLRVDTSYYNLAINISVTKITTEITLATNAPLASAIILAITSGVMPVSAICTAKVHCKAKVDH